MKNLREELDKTLVDSWSQLFKDNKEEKEKWKYTLDQFKHFLYLNRIDNDFDDEIVDTEDEIVEMIEPDIVNINGFAGLDIKREDLYTDSGKENLYFVTVLQVYAAEQIWQRRLNTFYNVLDLLKFHTLNIKGNAEEMTEKQHENESDITE